MKIYLIYKGNLQSLNHTGFKEKEIAQKEVDRINQSIIEDNERINKNPATGHGACFLNIKGEPNFNIREIEI